MTSSNWKVWRTVAAMLTVVICFGGAKARAAVVGPYTASANTVHLYHFDSADGNGVVSDSALSGQIGVKLIGGSIPPAAPTTPATIDPGLTGFSNAMNTFDGTSDGNGVDRKGASGGEEVAVNNVLGAAHQTSGFTMEAVVRFDLDPTVAFAQPMEIVSMENDSGLADRVFQWRLVRNTISSVAGWRMEFARLAGGTGNESVFGLLPTTGGDALAQGSWYHVAVSYDGTEAVAGNIQMYWTLMDPSRVVASALTSLHGNGSGINGNGFLDADVNNTSGIGADFAIGNELRDLNRPSGSGAGEAENFEGLIDEVRITSGVLAAGQMMFAVPEIPGWAASGVCLLGLVGLSQLKRYRKVSAADDN